jgi:hypothetical protein
MVLEAKSTWIQIQGVKKAPDPGFATMVGKKIIFLL